MADSLPTTWQGKPHTFAKHQILTTYLNAWVPIMSRQLQRQKVERGVLLFVDGFAGPGVYAGGEEGSPVQALRAVLNHTHDLPIPIRFLFVESRPDRFAKLSEVIAGLKKETDACQKIARVTVKLGDCDAVLNDGLDKYAQRGLPFGPALVFLDQFGYSDVSMSLVERIMSQASCETFLYLNWERMFPYLTDETKWSAIDRAYGCSEWKHVLDLPVTQRQSFMLNTYRKCLRERAATRFVWHFAMCDRSGKLVYWLFFCTNSLRGLEEMKGAMWKVDPSGGFRFSDAYGLDQLLLLSEYTEESLAKDIVSSLGGGTHAVGRIREWVLTETPHHIFKGALARLEKDGLLTALNAPPNRRAGSFRDESMVVRIESLPR